jgi:acetyl-CoA carboxylase carboxyl transferase subunit alpha
MNTSNIEKKLGELKKLAQDAGLDIKNELDTLEKKVQNASDAEAVWRRVELARHPDRPYSLDYITRVFSDFTELHGDRRFCD